MEEQLQEDRPPWDVYFSDLAKHVSTRSTCSRKKVGAVIVKDKNILATGYNGSISGLDHCTDVGCMMDHGHCVRTVHAENNAITSAAKHGSSVDGASIYVTASPCWSCFKQIANAGISRIVFSEFYNDERIMEYASRVGIELLDISELR